MSLEKELKRLDELRFAEEPDEAIQLFLKIGKEGGMEHIRPLCLLFEDEAEQPVQVEFLIDTIDILIEKEDIKQGIKEVVNLLPDIHKRGDEWIYFLNRRLLRNYFEAYVEEVKHSDIEIKKIIKPHMLELKDMMPRYENTVNEAIERMEL